ncbi:MAG TPA: ABC transporter permease [Candidatus Polarisedimenticolia bacterium]|nr:ABC transporter permease [Candidatus Polarisedimenticolia bacterium]
MFRLGNLLSRFWNLFRKQRLDHDLNSELQTHLDFLTEENIRRGMNPTEATRAARREFGGLEQTKELYRDQRGLPFLETLLQDALYALRLLRKSPGFTAVSILALALGIGASTSVFSLINAVLIRTQPYREPERLVYFWSPNPRFQLPVEYLTPMNADFFDLQKQNRSFASLALFGVGRFNLASQGRAEAIGGARVTGDFFKTMGISPALGRTVDARDDQPGQEQVAVISNRLWRTQFGAEPDILGKSVLLDARPYQIIGVMPPGFGFPHATDVMDAAKVTDMWIAWAMTAEQRSNRNDSAGNAIGRLRQGVSLEQAQSEMSTLMAKIDLLRPVKDRGFGALVHPFVASVTGAPRRALLLLMGAVTLLLLIACSNVASLAMARATGRIREMGVRAALGAGRSRLIRQLLTESFFLAVCGGTFGCGVAFTSIRLLMRVDPGNIPRLEETSLDSRVLFFTLGVSLLTGLLFGLFPALTASRCDPSEVLTHSGTRSVKGTRSRFRRGLIVVQVALSFVLLTGSGLLIRSLWRVQSVEKGFEPHSTVTMNLSLDQRYSQPDRQISFYRELIDRLSILPSVQAAGAITNLPFGHGETLSWLTVEGYPFDEKVFFQTRSVTPHYFAALGIRLLEGQSFTNDDCNGHPLVAIVNRSFAEKYFRGKDVLGKRFHFIDANPKPVWWTIIGVVADVRHASLEEQPQLQAYLPFWQASASAAAFVLRTSTDPTSFASAVQKELNTIDPALAVADIRTMDQLVSESTAMRRLQTFLLSVFATVALLLSLVGLYALLAYSVRQRTAEIGVRMALGARMRDVLWLVIGQGVSLALVGIALGLVSALGLTRLLASLLFEVQPTDAVTFLSVALVFCVVALVACCVPARRATRVDPMIALRHE